MTNVNCNPSILFITGGKDTANNGNLDSSGDDSSDDENEADGLSSSNQVSS